MTTTCKTETKTIDTFSVWHVGPGWRTRGDNGRHSGPGLTLQQAMQIANSDPDNLQVEPDPR